MSVQQVQCNRPCYVWIINGPSRSELTLLSVTADFKFVLLMSIITTHELPLGTGLIEQLFSNCVLSESKIKKKKNHLFKIFSQK